MCSSSIKIGAAVIFFGFGVVSVVQASTKLPPYGWAIGAGITLLLIAFFVHMVRKEGMSKMQFTCPTPVDDENELAGVGKR